MYFIQFLLEIIYWRNIVMMYSYKARKKSCDCKQTRNEKLSQNYSFTVKNIAMLFKDTDWNN